MDKKSVAKNYRFLAILLSCMVAGALLGWFKPKWGHSIAFLGTVFINMMFCVVVPLVFASIAGSVANMESRQRAGKIMGVTVGTFVITGAIAAVLMFVLMKLFPPVLTPWADMVAFGHGGSGPEPLEEGLEIRVVANGTVALQITVLPVSPPVGAVDLSQIRRVLNLGVFRRGLGHTVVAQGFIITGHGVGRAQEIRHFSSPHKKVDGGTYLFAFSGRYKLKSQKGGAI